MKKLKIHSENILPIIKQWLYSDKDIFLRELVSNASDALKKLSLLSKEEGFSLDESELKVEVSYDPEKKLLSISDNGIGMTAEEVETYIAQIAFSGAEEFIEKYKGKQDDNQMIGHFGLGFYSAFMVASLVEIQTLSYKEAAKPAHWSCDGSTEYELNEGTRTERGTTVILHLNDEDYASDIELRDILLKYCRFLSYPLYFNGTHFNKEAPLFCKAPSECTDEDYRNFYRLLYPLDPEPIFWIHLNVDYPFNLKGILYFPKLEKYHNYERSNIQLFCNRIFVTENCHNLLPDFLTVLKGAIDSADIPLNVSRSTLQMDRTVRQVASHISKKIADRLHSLYMTDKEAFLEKWPDIELVLKLGALQDEKFFERIEDLLVFKNTKGEWTNIKEYLERNDTQKIYYTNDEKSHALDLYKEKEILLFRSHLDSPLTSQFERKEPTLKFQRIDSHIEEEQLDKTREKNLLDQEGRTEAGRISEFFKEQLGDDSLNVEAKSLSTNDLPALLLISEKERRLREYMSLSNQPLPDYMLEKKSFVLNTNSALINKIYGLRETKPELAKALARQLFDHTRLSQRELDPGEIPDLIRRSQETLLELL